MKKLVLFAVALVAGLASAKDLGFRYVDGVCKNGEGVEGLNPGYLGQCADLRNVTLLRFNLEDTDFSGSDFTASDLQDTSFKNSILTDVKFSGAFLSGVIFDGAQGRRTVFAKANLINAHFAGATLDDADFTGADFTNGQLSYLSFVNGKFEEAIFAHATMDHIDLTGANLSGAKLIGANLSDSILDGSLLDRAVFTNADLSTASLVGAGGKAVGLRNAILRRAKLQSANFEGSDLRQAIFEGADLSQAKLTNSDLRSSNLKSVRITGTEFTGSKYSKKTQLPFDESKAAELGMVFFRTQNLLVIWDTPTDANGIKEQFDSLRTYLAEFGIEIKFSDLPHAQFDGTEDLSDYGAIFHMQGTFYYLDMPATGQRAIVDFVRGGGAYFGSQWIAYALSRGMLNEMKDLILTTYDTSTFGDIAYSVVADKRTLPILDGVENFSVYASHAEGKLIPFRENPSIALIESNGQPRVVYREVGDGQVVNFMFPVNQNDPVLANPNIQRIILNGIGH